MYVDEYLWISAYSVNPSVETPKQKFNDTKAENEHDLGSRKHEKYG